MNIVFNDSNTSIGGIEVLFIELATYYVKKGYKVYFLAWEDNIYKEYLSSMENVFFIKRRGRKPLEICSDSEIKSEKEFVLSQLPQNEKFHVISPYFDYLQYSLAIFGNDKRFKLVHLWAHPQIWANQSRNNYLKSNSFIKTKNRGKKYYYQAMLLELLADYNADFYSSRAIPVFNSWYYEIDLNPEKVEALPIQSIPNSQIAIHSQKKANSFSIVWCGRFTYSKNEAIIHIHQILEKLAENHPTINFNYDIIGFGPEKDTNYIQSSIKANKVNVSYLGSIDPKKLVQVFHKYDIGVGMGLTVKKMGQVGLPAIVIDSFDKNILHLENSNWIFDTDEGDAGDGYYFKIAGKSIKSRQKLFDLLNKIVVDPSQLTEYSEKSIKFVETYYSLEKQADIILERAINSKLSGLSLPVYRKNILSRNFWGLIYNIYNRFKPFLKKV